MGPIREFPIEDWRSTPPPATQREAIGALEAGRVLHFPRLGFAIEQDEAELMTPAVAAASKNVSLDTAGRVRGSRVQGAAAARLAALMARFTADTARLLQQLLPHYDGALVAGRTSFRPVEIAGRSTSWRKDDTRLHVDSFPSSPVGGNRILRVFCNVHLAGVERVWRLGEPFEDVARRYLADLRSPIWGSSVLLRALRVTRSRRSVYDHFMLQLHDRMKADVVYQSSRDHFTVGFPAGSTWAVFTDQVPHAAIAGQFALEQTFYLPVGAMQDPARSPLRTLERLTARKLT